MKPVNKYVKQADLYQHIQTYKQEVTIYERLNI